VKGHSVHTKERRGLRQFELVILNWDLNNSIEYFIKLVNSKMSKLSGNYFRDLAIATNLKLMYNVLYKDYIIICKLILSVLLYFQAQIK
jgi:hypothetical protein